MPINHASELQKVLDRLVDGKKIFGASFALKKEDLAWQGCSGNLSAACPFFIASTTKLFTAALVLVLKAKGILQLEDAISRYLDDDVLKGLHVYKGVDYSRSLTIAHLLSHTSGLPDYFQDKGSREVSLEKELMAGRDQSWDYAQAIALSKAMSPVFAPGAKGKAHYADTNFQLLGMIIENTTGKPYFRNCEDAIVSPLGLADTRLYRDPSDSSPQNLYYKSAELHIPQAMASFGPDGGIVSTASDLLIFIEAFFSGRLFPAEYIEGLKRWNKIFFPMQAGMGIHRFKLPWYLDPLGAVPEFVGHSGLSGALAFYCPGRNLFLAGTVNQIAHPDLSFRTMIKLMHTAIRS